jgi:hypothetical protein
MNGIQVHANIPVKDRVPTPIQGAVQNIELLTILKDRLPAGISKDEVAWDTQVVKTLVEQTRDALKLETKVQYATTVAEANFVAMTKAQADATKVQTDAAAARSLAHTTDADFIDTAVKLTSQVLVETNERLNSTTSDVADTVAEVTEQGKRLDKTRSAVADEVTEQGKRISANTSYIDQTYAYVNETKAAQHRANEKLATGLADHESRITNLESNTNKRFSDLNDRVNDNRKRASTGIAGVAAMANIPPVLQGQTFNVGATLTVRALSLLAFQLGHLKVWPLKHLRQMIRNITL